jgi:lipopolysaccharide biosynthesis regulator YciM
MYIWGQDFAAATALLEPLVVAEETSAESRAALGRVYLQAGQLDRAEAHFAVVAADDVGGGALESTKALNAAFLASARGEWDAASEILRELFAQDDTNYAVSIYTHRSGLGLMIDFLRPLIISLWRFLAKAS